MDKVDFREWARHFVTRFPVTGAWFMGLQPEVRDAWFDDVFSTLELRDCMAVNAALMADGELAAYDREKIPSIFIKRCQEVRHARQAKERKTHPPADEDFVRRAKRRGGDPFESIRGDRIMGRAFGIVTGQMRELKDAGKPVNDEVIHELVERAFEENYDEAEDSALDEPSYKCPKCCDTGLRSYRDSQKRPMVGHCDCTRGIVKRDQLKWASGRTLGPASHEVVEWEY